MQQTSTKIEIGFTTVSKLHKTSVFHHVIMILENFITHI